MATFSELQDRVERRVIDLPAAVVAEVPDLINEAIKTLQNEHNYKVMEALGGPYSTVANTRALTTVPSNFKEFRGKPYTQTDAGETRQMAIAANREAINSTFGYEDTGEPRAILQGEPSAETGAASFEVWPLTNSASDYENGEYRIYIPYWKFTTALAQDGDTNWFTVNALNYIINKATAEAFALDWDEERMAIWEQKAELRKKEVLMADKKLRLSAVSTIVPLFRGVNDTRVQL